MEQALSLAQRLHDPVRLIGAHANLGISLGFVGEFVLAYTHLEQALTVTVTPPFSGQHSRGLALAYAAFTLWMLGYPDQALTRNHEALMLAQGGSHPFDLARALDYATLFHQLRRDVPTAQARAEAALALSTERGFAQLVGQVTFRRAWALAVQGQHEVGMAQMHQGLAARQATGSVVRLSEYHARLAEVHGAMGQAKEGLHLLAEALAHVDTTGERYYEAEVYRIKGEILLRQAVPDVSQAEACFQQALAVARHQQARSWELRAALSLSRLWQRQGKCTEARELLAPIYGWFTEGFDTADLQEAKALLEELA